MKLQLDTTAKTIKLDESVNLAELVDILEKILPDNQWKNFKLETNSIINWSSPIIIERYPHRPFLGPWYGTDSGNYRSNIDNINEGIYNLSIE